MEEAFSVWELGFGGVMRAACIALRILEALDFACWNNDLDCALVLAGVFFFEAEEREQI
jgi:hypothetical protein